MDPARWWEYLDDRELDSLIDRAIAANPDLGIAFSRLQEARMQEAVVNGGSLPAADLSAGAGADLGPIRRAGGSVSRFMPGQTRAGCVKSRT